MARSVLSSSLVALCLLAACDRQVGSDYQGDPLLRIRGSVSMPVGLEVEHLVPAIAWNAVSAAPESWPHLRVAPVDVTGDFPSSVQLDVFDPPPAEALLRHDIPGEPAYAVGRVTAVAQDYPDAVTQGFIPNACGAGCNAHLVCAGDTRVGPEQTQGCYRQDVDCNAYLASHEDDEPASLSGCDLTGTGGNEALAFAGLSHRIEIVYFEADVEADTVLAERFGGGEAIAAGYHLYERRELPPAEVEDAADYVPTAAELCYADAVELALARYNAERGTNHTDESWGYVDGQPTAEHFDYQRGVLRAKRELGCPRPESEYSAVDADVGPIAIELSVPNLMTSGF